MNEYTLLPGYVLKGEVYRYRIERVLGRGSFGITYLATTKIGEDLGSLEIKVAVKEFFMKEINDRTEGTVTGGSKGGIFSDYKRKFIQEARNLIRLKNHKNIVNVLEAFEANNTAYYVMEYIDGGSLDARIGLRGRLPEPEALRLTGQIGSALSYMHDNRILHLNMKPSNVMLRGNGEAVLIDFGLSKHYDNVGNPESSTTIGGGTPGYAPLEQSEYREGNGFPVTMDVYALGATLFKMLTGERPPEATIIFNDEFPRYAFHGKNVSDRTIYAVEKAMSPKRGKRYQSVREFLEALGIIGADGEETDFSPSLGNQETERVRRKEEERRQAAETEKQQKARERVETEGTEKERLAAKKQRQEKAKRQKNKNIICLTVYYVLVLIVFCVLYSDLVFHRHDVILLKIGTYALAFIGILIGSCVFKRAERKRISAETKEKYDNSNDISESFISTFVRREKSKSKKKLYFNKKSKNFICFIGIATLSIVLGILSSFDILITFFGGCCCPAFWLLYAERKRIKAEIDQNYDMISEFSDGLACVEKDGKWGFIDRNADVVIPLKYDSAVWFTEKLAMVEIDGKYGFVNKDGNEAIPLIYDNAAPFYRGKALVEEDGKKFYIDKKGRYVESRNQGSFQLSAEEASVLTSPKEKKKVWPAVLVIALLLIAGIGVWWWFKAGTEPKTFTVNGVSFEMIYVKGGTFMMGAQSTNLNEHNYDSEAMDEVEAPVHQVTLSDYYIGKYEVTQGQWKAVMGSNPSRFNKGDNYPVECVSWNDIQEFIRKLNEKTGKTFGLPTEAQWEYAARGGNRASGTKYSGSRSIDNVAWYSSNSGSATHPVGTKSPNALGLYDMSGNVWEWCADWYDEDYYQDSPSTNPQGPSSGSDRVLRGGSWGNDARGCRVSTRFNFTPGPCFIDCGFRLALLP